jgi:hypothetical protein
MMKKFGLVFLALLLTGCATRIPTTDARFSLVAIDREIAPINVIDSTAADNTKAVGGSLQRVPASAFEPTLIDVLRRRLAAEKLTSLENKIIEVRIARVETYVNAPSRQPGMIFVPAGAPLPAVILGVIIGRGIVGALSPQDKISLLSTFEIKVGDEVFLSQGGATVEARDAQKAMLETIDSGIENMLARLRAPPVAIDTEPLKEPPNTAK